MQITGYKIMDALEALKEKAQTLDSSFLGSVYAFENEPKPNPVGVMDEYERIESQIVRLQELQSVYNLAVVQDFEGERVTLERTIKLLGLMGRLKNQWQQAAKLEAGTGRSRRSFFMDESSEFTRSKDVEIAKRQVTREEAQQRADKYARLAQKLKQLVRAGNAQTVELESDPKILEI